MGLRPRTAYGIIRQSRGAIRFESEAGKGTTASVYLPLAIDPSEETLETAPERFAAAAPRPCWWWRTQARVRKPIVDVLSSAGLHGDQPPCGEEALRLCKGRKGTIDLAVLDVVMPEMSGLDLGRHRLCLRCLGIRLLYISGWRDGRSGAAPRHSRKRLGVFAKAVPAGRLVAQGARRAGCAQYRRSGINAARGSVRPSTSRNSFWSAAAYPCEWRATDCV